MAISILPSLSLTPITTGQDFLPSVFARAFDLITMIVFPLAFIGIVFIAFKMINSQGKPDAMATARKLFFNIVIGLAIILAADVIIRLISSAFTSNLG